MQNTNLCIITPLYFIYILNIKGGFMLNASYKVITDYYIYKQKETGITLLK